MTILDRLNRRITGQLRQHEPRMVVEPEAIRLIANDGSERCLAFARLSAATLYHRDVYTADAIVLLLSFGADESVEIFQDDPQWEALIAALDASGRLGVPAAIWQLQAIGDGAGAPPRILL